MVIVEWWNNLNLEKVEAKAELIFVGLIILAFGVRGLNLDYNAPFADEAIYVVMGRLGLFQWDWTSFAAGDWMAGSLFAYPPLTALAYTMGGIIGSRFLNVVFGTLTVVAVGKIAQKLAPEAYSKLALTTTVAVMALSGIPVAVSRLATYDMPAFFLFFLSLNYLLEALGARRRSGRLYFLSAAGLILGIFTKITVIFYAPLVLLLALILARKNGKKQNFLFRRYYLGTLLVLGSIYLLTHYQGLLSYVQTHGAVENVEIITIFEGIKDYLILLLPLWSLATFELISQKQTKLWLGLNLGAGWIIVIHMLTHRLSTLDKHLFFTYAFVAIMAGVGLAFSLQTSKRWWQKVQLTQTWAIVLILGYASLVQGYKYGFGWIDNGRVVEYITAKTNQDDLILSVEGPVTMMSVYDLNHPLHVTTYDWLSYRQSEGLEAYAQAMSDAYFNYVLIYQDSALISDNFREVQTAIKSNKDDSYQLVYQDQFYQLYQRRY